MNYSTRKPLKLCFLPEANTCSKKWSKSGKVLSTLAERIRSEEKKKLEREKKIGPVIQTCENLTFSWKNSYIYI